ncbi:hypothetical protein VP150E351_P0229 [Vibrio phage 150E35-1]|nr:hypothetical protein VP150E351_P0229 [Vibrio phage 150E35-1]
MRTKSNKFVVNSLRVTTGDWLVVKMVAGSATVLGCGDCPENALNESELKTARTVEKVELLESVVGDFLYQIGSCHREHQFWHDLIESGLSK